jgi:hypothetical protein
MATGRTRSHKHFRLDPVKIERGQKVLRADTETEAIDCALDFVISEYQRTGWRFKRMCKRRFSASTILLVRHALFGCGDAHKKAFFSFLLFTTATDIAC